MGKQTQTEREAVATARRARALFARWTAEEEAGYEGEVSWEELKRSLDAERRPPERKLFPEHDPS